jgi:hypothetical protein
VCLRANGNWFSVFLFPPASYIIRNFCKPIVLLVTCFHADFLLGLFFDSEDGCDMCLRNASCLSTDCTALYPRNHRSENLNSYS